MEQGEIAFDGGKCPKWFKSHFIEVCDELESAGSIIITFQCEDRLICQYETQIKDLVERSGKERWFDCSFEDEKSGRVLLGMEFCE